MSFEDSRSVDDVAGIEERVRVSLHAPRGTTPTWSDPVARVTAGIARRRQRRLTRIAVAVAIVVLAAPVYLGVTGLDRATPAVPPTAVVPWLDAPAPAPSIARVEALPAGRACTADDVSAGSGSPGAWRDTAPLGDVPNPLGDVRQSVHVSLHGDTNCTLYGSATLRARDPRTGRSVALPAFAGTVIDGGIKTYPATMTPGGDAQIDIVTAAACASSPDRYTDVELAVAGTTFALPWLTVSPGCAIHLGNWYVLRRMLNSPVEAAVTVPATVRRGSTLVYQVRLQPPWNAPYPLAGCPVFHQTFAGAGTWQHLNCTTGELPAGGLDFEMRLAVPADAPLGKTTLEWVAVFADGRVAIGNINTGVTCTVVA